MTRPALHWIAPEDPVEAFPELDQALEEPDGLLAAGGDLSPERLLYAYRTGIFPWYEDGQPILWWSPDPRCVIYPDRIHVSRRLRRNLRRRAFQASFNTSFDAVVAACAAPRDGQLGTWITKDMAAAYGRLHERGWAHSIEVWRAGELVGGLYGLAIGRVFFGESMFSRADDASKAAMVGLCNELSQREFALLDCQVQSAHLLSLGATLLRRPAFAKLLRDNCSEAQPVADWPTGRVPVQVT